MSVARALLILVIASGASTAWSLCLSENQVLPTVTLGGEGDDHSGQIVYDKQDKQLVYLPWSSASLTGKTFVLYYLAARKGSDDINKAFITALDKLPPQSHQLVVMLNIDDVFTGGKYLARKTFESNAKEHGNEVVFILDGSSFIQQQWCIHEKSSTIILVNAKGDVVRAKDGALTEAEIQDYLEQISVSSGFAMVTRHE